MAGKMDSSAALPSGDPLILETARKSAPFQARRGLETPLPTVEETQKPLRPPKERPPVADEVDPAQILSQAPSPPAPPTPTAPAAAPLAPPPFVTIPGGIDNSTSIPPDTAGAVGPNHVFNPLNNNVAIFDRGGTPISSVSLNAFWNGLGITGHTFDPKVLFDPYGNRFVFATMADAQEPSSCLLLAVTETQDPTQGWVSNSIRVDDAVQGQVWFDYPSVGFTSDKITAQVNLFTRNGNAFAGSTVYVFDKASLYNPPHQALLQRFVIPNQGATQAPAVTYDPTFSDQYLISRWSGNVQGQGSIACYRLSGNVAAGQATLNRIGFLANSQPWDAFPPGDMGQQSGIPNRVSVGDDRMLGACLRNGKLFCCHSVMLPAGGPSRSAIQLWEIDPSNWTVLNVTRIDDPAGAVSYAFPSIAANTNNDVVIGHAMFSGAAHPSAAFSFRPAGGTFFPPIVFAPGGNTYFKTFGGTINRWGDYSNTQVDPMNDIDFWTVQEFAHSSVDTWATMWARINIAPVQVAVAGT
jgi:hypothetical protein